MFLQMILFINLTVVCSFLVHDPYKVDLKDSAQYKIEENIDVKGHESFVQDTRRQFNREDKDKSNMNILANKHHRKSKESLRNKRDEKTKNARKAGQVQGLYFFTTFMSTVTKKTIHKRDSIEREEAREQYDYDGLVYEYYEESVEEARANNTYHVTTDKSEVGFIASIKKLFTINSKSNCTVEEINQIGPRAIYCIMQEYSMKQEEPMVLAAKLWRVTKIWFYLYLAIAIPLWFTKGWCCCCLCCKFFKPRQTIEEAKKYLITNPPGVYRTGKWKPLEYRATERERRTYEEFEHFMKSL